MQYKLWLSALLSSSFILVGCVNQPSATQQQWNLKNLENKNWNLSHIGAAEIKAEPMSVGIPSLQFDAATKRVSGSDGCNRIMGSYNIQGEHIKLGQIARTQRYCNQARELSQQYNTALDRVTAYQVYDQTLRLLDRHGNPVLQFSATTTP